MKYAVIEELRMQIWYNRKRLHSTLAHTLKQGPIL